MTALRLDETDHHLLALLQKDSSRTLAELGEVISLSPSAVQRRVDRYRKAGLLDRQVAVLDPVKADALLAVCLVTLAKESNAIHAAFRRRLLAAPEVQQLYSVSGDTDYVVVLASTGMAHHREVADRLLKDAPNIQRYTTMFVLDPVRAGLSLPTKR
ncbi:Lrp/AsnC family transcriptional regulator [Alloactinosynnema sp. L-07]|uniref:Lrp/AsnC family transcriptional regulator n=1 Tax=Alloactinosynnema sp. L-07 TaxID=1653480 RepID=UPI001E48933C|nr:Lrp/AsnC family transcriptional regulator [Alloactinosynnema sp. L-07]